MHLRDDERLVDHAAPLPGLLPLIPEDEPLEALRRLLVLPEDRGVGLGGVLIPHPIAGDEARGLLNHRNDLLVQRPLLLLPVARLHVPYTYSRVHTLASFCHAPHRSVVYTHCREGSEENATP